MADPIPPIATPDKPEKISRTMMKFISLAVAIVVWYVIYDTAGLSYTNSGERKKIPPATPKPAQPAPPLTNDPLGTNKEKD